MSVSIDVVPLASTIDMFGEPDASSAYSLSGHVSISLTTVKSLFEPCRPTRLVLQSLTVTFEGRSEMITARTGYVPFRLCTVTRELAPGDDVIELTNEGDEDEEDKPCVWNVVFNIAIPGWLPATSSFGLDDSAGTQYTLYAKAKFVDPDAHCSSGASWLSLLCWPFRSPTTVARAHTRIVVNRYTNASFPSPMSPFSAQCHIGPLPDDESPKMEVLVSVPECVDMSQSSFPFVMRLRAVNMDDPLWEGFLVNSFSIQLNQIETYRDTPSTDYTSRYPVPPPTSQPPHQPLIGAHSLAALSELGFFFGPVFPGVASRRSFSLLPDKSSGRFSLKDGNIFKAATSSPSESFWHIMESTLPFVQGHAGMDDSQWSGPETLKASGTSPLFNVRHEMSVTISCTYTDPEGLEKVGNKLLFRVPVRFVNVAPPLLTSSATAAALPSPDSHPSDSPRSSIDSETVPLIVNVAPSARNLPAYSQLFDATGERLIDYTTPLPLYSPPSTSKSLSSLPDIDATGKTPLLADDELSSSSGDLH